MTHRPSSPAFVPTAVPARTAVLARTAALACAAALGTATLLAGCSSASSAGASPTVSAVPAQTASSPEVTASGGATPAGTSPSASPSSPASASVSAAASATPARRTVVVTVDGKTVTPAPASVQVRAGEPLTLTVTSRAANELHVHGVDVEKSLPAGTPVSVDLTFPDPGVYEVETHEPSLLLLRFTVR